MSAPAGEGLTSLTCLRKPLLVLLHAPGNELAFEFPGPAIRIQNLSKPTERVWRDFREAPTDRSAVGFSTDLDKIVVDLASDQLVMGPGDWIDPGDAPRLNRRVPDTQGGSIAVSALAQGRAASGKLRYDPDILDSTAFEDTTEVDLALLQVLQDGFPQTSSNPPASEARITKVVRAIENNLDSELSLASLAREAGLSPFHCLRLFQHLTGVTPHQYIRRLRIRRAATLLAATESKVIDIATECGFEDVSNFNRAFHAEFGMNPRRFRSR